MEGQALEGHSAIVTAYERLVVEKSDGIGWLILNRPDAGNAFDALMLDELEAAWAELDADPDVRVIVNTANGKSFCTGMDVVQVARDKDAMRKPLPPNPRRRAEDLVVALRRVEAGDRGGQRRVRRRRAAPGRRRRHRHRRGVGIVRRPARLGRSGRRLRGHHAAAQVADGGDHPNDAERQG